MAQLMWAAEQYGHYRKCWYFVLSLSLSKDREERNKYRLSMAVHGLKIFACIDSLCICYSVVIYSEVAITQNSTLHCMVDPHFVLNQIRQSMRALMYKTFGSRSSSINV